MALVPGLVVALRIISRGNKVPLGEMVQRALSASLTPRVVFGGEDARRRLARKASGETRVVWGLVLVSLTASLLRRLRARCLFSSLASPQDRENRHVGGNVFVSFDGFAPVTLCNLYLYLSNKVPFLFYGEDDRGYRGKQRVTTLEYV